MAQVPRIRRADPTGTETVAPQAIPVVARLVWHDGAVTEVDALAVAWTRQAVQVEWRTPWADVRRDWIRADQVTRRSPRAG